MKDPVKSGAIFRLRNTAALKHARPPMARPSAFSGVKKSASSGQGSSGAPRRRVLGLGRSNGSPAFSRMVGKPVSKGTSMVLTKRGSLSDEEEGEEELSVEEEDHYTAVTSSSDTSEEAELSLSPVRASHVVERDKAIAEPSSSEEEEFENILLSSEDEEETVEKAMKAERKRRLPARRTTVKNNSRSRSNTPTPSPKSRPAERKAPRRRSSFLEESDEERQEERKMRRPQVKKGRSRATARKAPKQAQKAPLSSDSEEEHQSQPSPKTVKKAKSGQTGTRSDTRSSRRTRKPVTQWWAVNPDVTADLGRPPPKLQRRRLSEPTETKKTSPQKSTPNKKRVLSKPKSEPRKRRKKAEVVENGIEEMGEQEQELPKPRAIGEVDEPSNVPAQSIFAKSSPAKRLLSLSRRSSKVTPLNKKSLDSPHLTPITPARATRLVQALFTFDGDEAELESTAEMDLVEKGSKFVPMQPLRSSHDEFGMPSIPYQDSTALADANWYTMSQ